MIVAERKPLEAIAAMTERCEKVLAVGCGTCVTVCFSGGRQEVAVLAASLRMKRRIAGRPLDVGEAMVQRQCEREYVDTLAGQVEGHDAVLSLGCGVGVQALAERFPGVRVLPALDTLFMGMPTEPGVWEERCQGCGHCILDRTGGICPVSRCAKQLFNGPCGGSHQGRCEVDASIPCAWHQIWERAEALGTVEDLMRIEPARNWSTGRDGGPRRMVRNDLRTPSQDKGSE